jgi:hypothetical protein
MKWRYGIVKYYYDEEMKNYYYGIGEIYFENDPNIPISVTESSVRFFTETDDESDDESPEQNLFVQLERAMKDIRSYPIVDLKIFKKPE